MFFYFCGHRGSGKNYLADQVKQKERVEIIDTGATIRHVYRKYAKEGQSFGEWMKYNEKKHGENFSNEVICRASIVNKKNDYIVIGYRSIQGIDFFNNYFNIKDYKIVFIDGDYELFKNNYNERENKNVTQEEYQKIVKIEKDMGIEELREFAINNPKISEYYYKTQNNDLIFEKVLKMIQESKREMER